MTEEIAATPGWVEQRLDELFAPLEATPGTAKARAAYAACLASRKAPAAPSDMLGAEFEGCSAALHRALQADGMPPGTWSALARGLEALEAEIAGDS